MKPVLTILILAILLGACSGPPNSINPSVVTDSRSVLICSRRFDCEAEAVKICNPQDAQLVYSKQHVTSPQKMWADSLVHVYCMEKD